MHHNTVEDYQKAAHDHELPVRAESILHLDAAHAPIGSEMAWSIKLPEKYQVAGKDYYLEFEVELG